MKKKLVILGVVGALAIVILIIALTRSQGGNSGACYDMIRAIQDDNVQRSYSLLSDSTQQNISIESWTNQVRTLNINYTTGGEPVEPEFIEENESTNPTNEQLQVITEQYRLNTSTGPWIANCVFYSSDKSAVDNFYNEPDL